MGEQFKAAKDGSAIRDVINQLPKRNKKPSRRLTFNVIIIKKLWEMQAFERLPHNMKLGDLKEKERSDFEDKYLNFLVLSANDEVIQGVLDEILVEYEDVLATNGNYSMATKSGLHKCALLALLFADPECYSKLEKLNKLSDSQNRLQFLNVPGGPPAVEKQIYKELAEHANEMKTGYSINHMVSLDYLGDANAVKSLRGVDPKLSPDVTGAEVQEFRTTMGSLVTAVRRNSSKSGNHVEHRAEVYNKFINVTHKGANTGITSLSEGTGKVKDSKLFLCYLIWEDCPCDFTSTILDDSVRVSTEQTPLPSEPQYAVDKRKKELKRARILEEEAQRFSAIFQQVSASRSNTPVVASSSSSSSANAAAKREDWKSKLYELKFKSARMEVIEKAIHSGLIESEQMEALRKEYASLIL
jgi:hypothetical protein